MNHNRSNLSIPRRAGYLLLFSMILCFNLLGQNSGRKDLHLSASDSMNTLQAQKRFEDQGNNRFKLVSFLFSGLLFENLEKKQSWYIPSLFELFPPNTVEGFVTDFHLSYTQHLNDDKFYNLKPRLRYGFGNKRFQAQLAMQFYYNPRQYASIQLTGGRMVKQFNQESTLNALNNTYYTYVLQDNFFKIYEKSYFEIVHTIAPRKDFLLTTTVSWNNRNPLQNLPKYDEGESEFTSNNPINDELLTTEFDEHQALLWQAALRWQFGHQLIRQRGNLKSVSKSPALTLFYSGALSDLLQSDVSYQKIALQARGSFSKSRWGTDKFLFESGDFIAYEKLSFIDFKHFNGQRTAYGDFGLNDFQLLDYYQYSTTDFYFQGHYEHQLNPLMLRKGKTVVHPIVRINYLYTLLGGSYWEFGVGLNKIFKFWRVDFYNSWRRTQHESFGIRFGAIIE